MRDRVRQAQEALGAERVRQAVVRQARQFPGREGAQLGEGPARVVLEQEMLVVIFVVYMVVLG